MRLYALTVVLQIDASVALDNLRFPPKNRLEALTADRIGQHSIIPRSFQTRANPKRVVFGIVWTSFLMIIDLLLKLPFLQPFVLFPPIFSFVFQRSLI